MQPLSNAPKRRPLGAHVLMSSDDLDEAREKVARIFCPHRLDRIGREGRFGAHHHHLRGERLSLNYIEYGAKTLIAPGLLERFYLLQMPLSGAAMITNGAESYATLPGQAAVLNPHLPTTMIWGEGCAQILVQIDRQAMQDHLATVIGGRADRALTFRGPLDMRRGEGAALRQLILHLVAETDAGRAPIGRGGLLARSIESTILTGLLEAHSHNYSGLLDRPGAMPAPRHVVQAEAFILAHLTEPLTVETIATAAQVSPRALQLAFRTFRDSTPMGFWRDARLLRAHQDLIAAGPEASVTDIALRWGFGHFGRFADLYRRRFGHAPSTTLRSARAGSFSD
ncbi:MAG TPA: AraC family transcriptional regulator [Paracoccaceae bacterium]|nr:AraC family transcriptional regulator [Paracoccaceae bacterium]